MKKLLILAISMMIYMTAMAQHFRLHHCLDLYHSGYWNQAQKTFDNYLKTLEEGSTDYYAALSWYGELLYYMDNRQLGDSLMKLSLDKLQELESGKVRKSVNTFGKISGTLLKSVKDKNFDNLGSQLKDDIKQDPSENSMELKEAMARYAYMDQQSGIKHYAMQQLKMADITMQNVRESKLLDNPNIMMYMGDNDLKHGLKISAMKYYKLAQLIIDEQYDSISLENITMQLRWAKYYYTNTNYMNLLKTCDKLVSYMTALNITDGIYYADVTMYQAVAYSQLGNYKKSIELYQTALALYTGMVGTHHTRYATALYNLGQTYGIICEIDKMIETEKEAAKIFSDVLGSSNAEYAMALNEIGVAYSIIGDTANEFKYYLKSLEISKKRLGEGSVQTARQYYNIAKAYVRTGDFESAMEYIKPANLTSVTATGLNSTLTADCLTLRAYINMVLGDLKTANVEISSALRIYNSTLSEYNPKRAMALNIYGLTLCEQGKYDNASEKMQEAIAILRKDLCDNFSFMTAPIRNNYWENNADQFAHIIKLCWNIPENPNTTTTAFNCELISKGIKLSSEQEFSNIIWNSGNNELIREYNELQEMRQIINSERELLKEEQTQDIKELETRAQVLEEHLVRTCQEYGDMARPIRVTCADICNILKDNEIAIEFTKIKSEGIDNYGALIIKNGWNAPKFVSLFNAEDFDMKFGSRIKPYTNNELFKMVWQPMEQYFDNNSVIYFAPTGLLYNTAIEYAPVDSSSTISDKYRIYRISSSRNLVNRRTASGKGNVAIYGGIYYNTDTTTMRKMSYEYNRRSLNDEFLKNYFSRTGGINANYLPGTEKETQEILQYLKQSDINTLYFTKDKANEESLKDLSGKNMQVIHIATHGFYLDSHNSLKGDNALLMSGLLMSGCNNILNTPEDIDDGILTAREISYLDFRHTDMVVLSACETGLGKVTDDGVYGLQRGFKKAGVNTIIMSLWPVNDYATKLLMTGFYKYMLSGDSKHSAFLKAQKDLRAKKGVNPSHWAAFIMLDGE